MIWTEDKPSEFNDDITMSEYLLGVSSSAEKADIAIEVLKTLPIDGCITGSCFLDDYDPDIWGSDIDMFVYTEQDLTDAIAILQHVLKMTPGLGTPRTEKQERIKLNMLKASGLNYKTGITTYKFHSDGITINVSYKKTRKGGKWIPLTNCPSVLMSFDMSIIMQGYDIKTHTFFDMRPMEIDPHTAVPNPLRDHGCSMWNVDRWVRQFDRVVKYYNRGYDTRPMARFYLEMIDCCIKEGYLFDNDKGQQVFERFSEDFLEKRDIIKEWLDEHEED